MRTALTIAGSDSSSGAGIQADLKTFAALGVYGLCAITAVTAQNTCNVTNIREMDEAIIIDQITAVFKDIQVDAVKIGMLFSTSITKTVAEVLNGYAAKNIVVDPVMVSKNGSRLLKQDAIDVLKRQLFPLAEVVTPNLPEAAELTGIQVEDQAGMERAAVIIRDMGPRFVVVKGGHLPGCACDLLYDGKEFSVLTDERIGNKHTHGTGCTFSSAIAACLAKGMTMEKAVYAAKEYITIAIRHGFPLGKGVGPTHHFYELYCKAGIESCREDHLVNKTLKRECE